MQLDAVPAHELQYQVEHLLAEYAHCIDDDRLEDWPEFFVDQCSYKVVARENVDRNMPLAAIFCDSKGMLVDRVVSLRHANVYETHHYRHSISATLITDVGPESLRAHSNYVVFRTRSNGQTDIYNAGKYDDVIVAADGALKFREKTVIYDTSRIDTQLVTPL